MPTRYIGLKEMQQLTGKSHQTLWRLWTQRKEFPPPHKTKSGTFLGWPVTVYESWVNQQAAN